MPHYQTLILFCTSMRDTTKPRNLSVTGFVVEVTPGFEPVKPGVTQV